MPNLTITAANVAKGAASSTATGTAGEAITQGEVVFKNAAGNYVLSDADDTALDQVGGIALNAAENGQPVEVLLPGSDVTIGATLMAGSTYWLSATPGAIAPEADLVTGDRKIQLGWATSTTVLHFRPYDTGVII